LRFLVREKGLNIVEMANLKQVNNELMQEADAILGPTPSGSRQADGDGARQRHVDEARITQGEGDRIVGTARRVWEGWKRIARKIGDFQARAMMTLFYFVILAPVAIILRWRSDPLAIKAGTPRGWTAMKASDIAPLEHARRQF
jgi:hypothetical protein